MPAQSETRQTQTPERRFTDSCAAFEGTLVAYRTGNVGTGAVEDSLNRVTVSLKDWTEFPGDAGYRKLIQLTDKAIWAAHARGEGADVDAFGEIKQVYSDQLTLVQEEKKRTGVT